MRSSAARAYALLFFLSGATGLVYELLWVRVLYQTFGSTLQSVTTVVAAYMGGLGLGAWLLGRRADRSLRPAALYGWLEIAIGAFGAISPFALALVHRAYIGLASGFHLSGGASVALRFGLAALVLLVPTTLMGGTLPVLTRAFTGAERGELQRSLGLLYGLNTLGAVVGTALAGLFLIEHVGIRASLWATAVVNVALGMGALALAQPIAPSSPAAPVPSPPPEPRAGPAPLLRAVALVLLAATAFASLLDEIAWTRVLVMIVGGSTYAFTLVLLVFLLGIGIGSRIVARASLPPARTAAYAALAQAVTAAGASLLFVVFAELPRYIIAVFQVPTFGATERLLAMGLLVGGVVLIPAVGMGMTFPLLTELVAPADTAGGAAVGRAYALNTLGSIAGAVLTGFVLVVTLGTDVTLRVGVGVNVCAALALAWLAARGVSEGSPEHAALRFRVLTAGGLATLAFVTALATPRWSTRLIDLGPSIYARGPMNAHMVSEFLKHRGSRQLMYEEGWNATVSVWEGITGRALKVNGKADASDYGDMDTQIMAGLAPVAAHPNTRSAFVVGYGSGVTARVLSDVPGMQRVRVAEIEPAVLDAGRYFVHVNDHVRTRPNVSVAVDDARSALQLDSTRYDVIVSEPSNPWLAGVATLYTTEFFQVVRDRLADDGVFCQWVQLYQLPLPVVTGIVQNVHAVFPYVHIWFGAPGDVIVLGSGRPLRYDRAWLARLIGPGAPFATLSREYLGVDQPEDYFGHWLLGDMGVARLLEQTGIVHRDDRPGLEFVAARRFIDGRGTVGVFDSLANIRAATESRDSLSPMSFGRVLTVRRGDPLSLRYLDALRRTRKEPLWTAYTAAVFLAVGDTSFADSALTRLHVPGRNPEAWLLSGLVAAKRNQEVAARALLAGALAAGADSAEAGAALAALDARHQRWAQAAGEARAVLLTARGTLRHPFPRDWLADALTPFVLSGPTGTADSLLAVAVTARPGWYKLHELHAVAALRAGRCDTAADEFILLVDFGIELVDAPLWVERCRQALRR
ncbi:MAG TPA: fused MFS/spermidine synthase [Gemmatimonadales bacterium]|nr:fused MFS/spermidine synthase [Gemmatimonadales bacterium]